MYTTKLNFKTTFLVIALVLILLNYVNISFLLQILLVFLFLFAVRFNATSQESRITSKNVTTDYSLICSELIDRSNKFVNLFCEEHKKRKLEFDGDVKVLSIDESIAKEDYLKE